MNSFSPKTHVIPTSPAFSTFRLRRLGGEGGSLTPLSRVSLPNEDSPMSCSYGELVFEICSILEGGVESLSEHWPLPSPRGIESLIRGVDPAVAVEVARECRRIVQAADRAPNITGLYAKKLGEL